MACVAPELPAATESKTAESSTLLKGFNRAITAVTVCHTGGNQVGPNSSISGVFTCGVPNTDTSLAGKFNTKDLAKAADHEAQKVMNLLSQKMTVSKAIIEDVEVLSLLVERLFS